MCKRCETLAEDIGSVDANAKEALDEGGLLALLRMLESQADPETVAQAEINRQVETIMDLAEQSETSAANILGHAPTTAVEIKAAAESLGARLMFCQTPTAIAYTLALLIQRYRAQPGPESKTGLYL